MMKVHRWEKYSVTKYRYGITKYMPGVPETPPDQRRVKKLLFNIQEVPLASFNYTFQAV
jgi:hypothetical protein